MISGFDIVGRVGVVRGEQEGVESEYRRSREDDRSTVQDRNGRPFGALQLAAICLLPSALSRSYKVETPQSLFTI